MARRIAVDGYDAFMKAIEIHTKTGASILVLFSGSKDEKGQSWCPDCVSAEPVIEEGLKSAPDDAIFIHCSVGDREYWKNSENEFRKSKILSLTCVPTLMKWNTPKRLEEDQCRNIALVTMLFEE